MIKSPNTGDVPHQSDYGILYNIFAVSRRRSVLICDIEKKILVFLIKRLEKLVVFLRYWDFFLMERHDDHLFLFLSVLYND